MLDRTLAIPTIPEALAKAQRLAADPNSSLVEIADVIERDPAIAAQALRIANAPLYGLSHPVSSVRMTCIVLGLDALLNLIRQAAVLQLFKLGSKAGDFDGEGLWNHSFRCALAARYLAMGSPKGIDVSADTAYTCGLLHHVGKVIILHDSPDEFAKALLRSAEHEEPLRESLQHILGFDDSDVLHRLARRWNLGPELECSALPMTAHTPGEPGWAWSALVRAADAIARDVAPEPIGWQLDSGHQDALLELEVDPEFYTVVCGAVTENTNPG